MIIETRGRKPKLSVEQQREIINSKLQIGELSKIYKISESAIYQLYKKRNKGGK